MSRDSYDRLAPFYDAVAAPFEWPMVQRGLALLAAREGERILEVGHGTGRALEALARSVGERGRVVGIDFSPGMARVAQRRVDRAGLGARVVLRTEDATTSALAPSSFDAIFSAFTVEIFDDATAARLLASWRDALAPGGRVVLVSMAAAQAGAMAALYRWSHRRFPAWVDCRPIDAAALLTRAGFCDVQSSTHRLAGLPVAVSRGRTTAPGRS